MRQTLIYNVQFQAVRNADFFTGNGALKAIGTFPFTQYSVKIIGFKLKGVIFLTLVGADDEKKETEADYVRDYMGSKFEQYMTSKEPGVSRVIYDEGLFVAALHLFLVWKLAPTQCAAFSGQTVVEQPAQHV